MNAHDMLLLVDGMILGVELMLGVYIGGQILDDRRDRKALAAARAQPANKEPDFVDIYADPALIGEELRP